MNAVTAVVEGSASRSGRGLLPTLLGESPWYQTDLVLQPGGTHGVAVPAAAFGGARGTLAVHVRDAFVAEAGEVLDGEPGTGHVVAPDHVDGSRTQRTGHDHDREPLGQLLEEGPRQRGTQEHQRLAAIVQQ